MNLSLSGQCVLKNLINMEIAMRNITAFFGLIGTLFIAFIVFLLLLSSVRIIEAGEVGIKTEFGRVVDVLEPNIHFVVPIMNDVKYLSTQIQKFETGASAASKDLQMVDTQIAVNYRISGDTESLMDLWERFRGNHEIRIIAPLVQEVVKANTAKFNAEELITKRVELKSNIAGDLERKLEPYGIDVVEVSITDLKFSPEFDAAIEAKVVAEQKLQKEKIDLETKKIEVQKLVAQQNATAEALLIQASADAKAKVLRAEGDAEAKVIQAEAEAEAISKITASITDPYVRYFYVSQWDGVLPKVMGENAVILDMGGLEE